MVADLLSIYFINLLKFLFSDRVLPSGASSLVFCPTSKNRVAPPLSQKQLQAVKLLASGKNQSEVATQLGVNRRTIARWCDNPTFSDAIASARPKIIQKFTDNISLKTTELIEVNLPKAIKTVVDILDDVEARNCDKLRAAQLLGKWGNLERSSESETKSQPELDLRAYLLNLPNKN